MLFLHNSLNDEKFANDKKLLLLKKGIITFLCLSLIFLNTKVVKADTLLPNAKSGLLMEVSTGTIIYEKNIHEKVSVASMTKMMGMILVMEALEDGNIRLDEKIKTSKNASNMGGSQIWLEEGEEIRNNMNDILNREER